jgi:hypothetical protein
MKIIAISDTHDNVWNLDRFFKRLKQKPDILIHCGDWCAPFMLHKVAALGVVVHGVFGNVDGDRALMMKIACTQLEHFTIHFPWANVEEGGRKIAVVHEPAFAEALFLKAEYDVVFYGHTHTPKIQKEGERALICPGEIMGLKNKPTFCLYDTLTGEAKLLELE